MGSAIFLMQLQITAKGCCCDEILCDVQMCEKEEKKAVGVLCLVFLGLPGLPLFQRLKFPVYTTQLVTYVYQSVSGNTSYPYLSKIFSHQRTTSSELQQQYITFCTDTLIITS
jgi:hypothetical protein